MLVHEHCSFGCRGLLINWLYRVYILFTWTTEAASENVFEFTVEPFVEKNIKARIDGTIGVWQKVKTGFHVSEGKQSFICVSEKVSQQMHYVSRQPTKSKRNHHDDEHAQYLPLRRFILTFLMSGCDSWNLTWPQATTDKNVQPCDDSKRNQIEHHKRGHKIGPSHFILFATVARQIVPNHSAVPAGTIGCGHAIKENQVQRETQRRWNPNQGRH